MSDCIGTGCKADSLMERIAALEAELDALAKDAERYRWLRLASLSKGDHDYYAKVDRWSVSVENSGFGHSFHADALDAAIDAAREKSCDCVRPEIHGHQLLCKQGNAR